MQNPLPVNYYRDIVRELCLNYRPADSLGESEQDFYAYLDESYQTDKQMLSQAGFVAGAQQSVSGVHNGLFVFAVGLFTFGRLDVVEDIVKRIPSEGAVRRLETVINVLLPLPDHLEPIEDPGLFHQWLESNRDQLVWDSDKGLFVLVSQ